MKNSNFKSVNNESINMSNINKEINSIFQQISMQLDEDIIAMKEEPKKGASCKGIISIYNKKDVERAKKDTTNNRKAKPLAMYTFYPSIYDEDCLGSVAIYGDNAKAKCMNISLQPTFFGHKVMHAKVEMGMRPFVDVKLRA